MAKTVHIDTSALVDLCFWDKEARAVVLARTSGASELLVTPYVLFELARGFLSYLVALHNKTLQFTDIADVIGYGRRLYRQGYRQAAVLQSYETFLRGQTTALNGSQQLALFEGDLCKRIRRGWRCAENYIIPRRNPCGCRDDLPPPVREENGHYRHKLPTANCGELENCGIRDYVLANATEFKRVRAALESNETRDDETTKRVKALREMVKLPRKIFHKRHCWNLGDVVIVHETAKDGAVLTKNLRHFVPIGQIVGRTVWGVERGQAD